MDQGSARRAKAHRESGNREFHGHKHNVIVSLETPRVSLSRPSEEGHVSHDRPYRRSETPDIGTCRSRNPEKIRAVHLEGRVAKDSALQRRRTEASQTP
jgi:hypothetical protein